MKKNIFFSIKLILITLLISNFAQSQLTMEFAVMDPFNSSYIDVSKFPILQMKFKAYDDDKLISLTENQIYVNDDNVYSPFIEFTSPDAAGWQTFKWYSQTKTDNNVNIFVLYNDKVYYTFETFPEDKVSFANFFSLEDKYFKDYQFGEVNVGSKASKYLYLQALVTKKDDESMQLRIDSVRVDNNQYSYYWYGFKNDNNPPPTNITSPFKYLVDGIYQPTNSNYSRSKLTAYYASGQKSSINLIGGWFNVDRNTVLQMIYPNGGEKFAPCELVNIKWKGNSRDLPTIVEYTNDGLNYVELTRTKDSTFLWKVPNETSDKARIRVRQELQNTSTRVLKLDNIPIFRVNYRKDGSRLITGNYVGNMVEWDLNTYTPIKTFSLNGGTNPYERDTIRGLQYTDIDKFAVCYFLRNTIYRQDTIAYFDYSSNTPLFKVPVDTNFKTRDMVLSPDGKILTLIPELGNKLLNYSAIDGSLVSTKTFPYPISAFSYSKENNQSVIAFKNGLAQILSYPDFSILAEYDFKEIPIIHQIALSPNKELLAVSCLPPTPTTVTGNIGESHIYHIATKQIIRTQRISASQPLGLQFNPSSTYCVMANVNSPQIAFWDMPTSTIPGTLSGNNGELTDMDYSPDGGSIAATARNSAENLTIRYFTYPESDSSDKFFSIIKPVIILDTIFFQPNYYYNQVEQVFEKKICNNGPVDLVIDNAWFKQNKHFRFKSISTPDTVKVGDCKTIELVYMPLDTGWVADTLYLNSCFGSFPIAIKGYSLKRNIDFVKNDFNFGESCLSDSVVMDIDFIKNNDPIPALINYIGISKGIDSPFRLLTNIKDTILNPGQVLRVKIKFSPKTIGQNLDQVMIFYSNQKVLFTSSNLSGLGIGTQVAFSHNDLRFIPEILTRKITIKNESNNPVSISKTDILPTGYFNVITPLPLNIPANQSVELEVVWNGKSINKAVLKLTATPCVSQSEINLGEFTGNSIVTAPSITTDANDENVKLKINFENSSPYEYLGKRFFESDISINPRIFLPLSITSNFGTASIISNDIINDKRIFKVRIEGDFPNTGTVAEITGVAGLAETDTSTIEILKASQFWGSSVKTITNNGLLTINNLCGDRRIKQTNKLDILSISPYPANEFIQIEINSEHEEIFSITITDLVGTNVFTKEYKLSKGINMINIPLQNLSSGYYYLIIKNLDSIDTRKILILK